MGYGVYTECSYMAATKNANITASSSVRDTFSSHIQTNKLSSDFNLGARIHNTSVPKEMLNVGVRECRDSEEHPNTTPIIIAFDVTGSMGRIPLNLIKNQFPHLMSYLKEIGVQDPQILFMAIGDHYSDSYPIQVDQFEIDSEKIVNSLKTFYIEGGGGGNGGESYLLSWIIAGYHTETDAWFKRGKKGFLFTIGDEHCHKYVESMYLHRHLQYENGCSDITAKEALEKAQEQYHVFHIHCTDGSYSFNRMKNEWGELLGDNLLSSNSENIPEIIGNAIKNCNSESISKKVENFPTFL